MADPFEYPPLEVPPEGLTPIQLMLWNIAGMAYWFRVDECREIQDPDTRAMCMATARTIYEQDLNNIVPGVV